MAALAHNILLPKDPIFPSFSGNSLKPPGKNAVKLSPINPTLVRIGSRRSCKNRFTVRADYGDDAGRSGSGSAFIGGFVLGGLIVGTLGCVFAPQISKALSGADRKDLMRKLPKFIYDEDKALERTRKVLTEKIAQLNSAIDDVSSQLRADDVPNGAPVASDELEASIYD